MRKIELARVRNKNNLATHAIIKIIINKSSYKFIEENFVKKRKNNRIVIKKTKENLDPQNERRLLNCCCSCCVYKLFFYNK